MRDLRIQPDRLWDSLMEMARVGATSRGGCNRQALTDEDRRGRELFIGWCKAVGCAVRVDEIGNIFCRLEGAQPKLPAVLIGSHLDTQPTGGRFDGVYGVLAGLEVLRTLDENGVETRRAVEVVSWTNEEGARFPPALMGSGVWSGAFDLQDIYRTKDRNGAAVLDELERIGFKGDTPATPMSIEAAFEVHIEQGPILEQEGLQIGVVTGVQGIRWYDVVIEGEACHAGPTPMERRRDPFAALAPIIQESYGLATRFAPWSRVTFGDIRAIPGSRNTVPEKLLVHVDIRHADADVLEEMGALLRRTVARECDARGLASSVDERWHMPVTQFDPACIDAVWQATRRLGYGAMEMVSGAGHDSVYVASVAPATMIFVPCENGISHNEAESAKREDLEAGANVLLQAVLQMAC